MAYTVEAVREKAEALLGGGADETQMTALGAVCAAAKSEIEGRLRAGVSGEDIGETFVTACGLLAIAMCIESAGASDISSFKAGGVSVTRPAGQARSSAAALRRQAEELLCRYLEDSGFGFMGVRG